ncbi:uncharacterized protein F5891DRAFT_979944 [Suillus fuscotomentosus]|uniref:Uncharacterized protein n=1 Tax=Suillus fuscotomentosus TaxID=1912939 RepID=A0AAD4E7G9_9AGAM|nr:uncharacterized protein F5891DRAFT_979944 [Suillus fuscotomentosus]KAG1900706.1 hypothetical protein F5891DRAFT_979944 [Suillus fuscotomentosus]
MFVMNFSTDLIGKKPAMVSIDGGYTQTEYQSFNHNGESNLDLQYGMTMVTGKQNVTLYQTGDMVEGALFNNFLDAIDGSYCMFKGGDDYTEDAQYSDPYGGGYEEYVKLGLMDITILYSSGDYGVAGHGNYCLNPDGIPCV